MYAYTTQYCEILIYDRIGSLLGWRAWEAHIYESIRPPEERFEFIYTHNRHLLYISIVHWFVMHIVVC